MIAVQCDRCGAIFEERGHSDIVVMNIKVKDLKHRYCLCTACQRGLEEYLNIKKSNIE